MVAVRDTHLRDPDSFSIDHWLQSHLKSDSEREKLGQLFARLNQLHQEQHEGEGVRICPDLTHGIEMIEILQTMNMDFDTMQVALMYRFYLDKRIDGEWIEEEVNAGCAALMKAVLDMDAIRTLHSFDEHVSGQQIDNLRRMLLAMVEDVRAVVIKLSERICYLRSMRHASEADRVLAAREVSSIYSPLANRLGIGQLKWELEDLSFHYLHPHTYKQIAKQLDERRLDREAYISDFVSELSNALEGAGVNAETYGRPKHIYSIWKKMQKKQLDFTELFDVRAVRVIAEDIAACYAALGIIHTLYHPIPSEFDDYVANPKPNGYQSIHTVVIGPSGKNIEIQIRTRQMHEDAELGVAAHWKYKEGDGASKGGFEERIAWLRKLLAWQDDMTESGSLVEELRSQVFDDRVYVFTPKGDVIDMPSESTPLDFAYYIHSQIGHRCIGAKIGGRIVPFTYQLQTGDQIEVLTQKQPNPSRDWLNPNLGYVRSARARSKIGTYFKKLDRDKNIIAGKEILENELEKAGFQLSDLEVAFERFNIVTLEDMMAGVGGGDLRINQIINHLQNKLNKVDDDEADRQAMQQLEQKIEQKSQSGASRQSPRDHVVVEGVGNLMTHIARCCQPIPGDEITGYITQGRGISIHRNECLQLQELKSVSPERLIDASWSQAYKGGYDVTLRLRANDRVGLLKDVSTLLNNEKVTIINLSSRTDTKQHTTTIDIEVEMKSQDALSRLITRLGHIKEVLEVSRLI